MSVEERPMLPEDGERYLPWMSDPAISYEHLHRYWFARGLCAGKRVLDLASGEGYGSDVLASAAASVVGVDIDAAAVRHAAGRYVRPNLRYVRGSITDVPLEDARFDVIVCFEALEHIADHDRLFAEVRRLLAPGGLFLVSTPNKRVYSDEAHFENPHHVHELYWEEFRTLVEGAFAHVRWFGQQLYPGGLIFPLDAPGARADECVIARAGGEYRLAPSEAKVARYFMAVASDAPVPPVAALPGSFLIDLTAEMVPAERLRLLEQHAANLEHISAEKDRISLETAEAHRAAVHGLQATLAEKEEQLAAHQRSIYEHREVIEQLRQALTEHQQSLAEHRTMLAEHQRVLGEQARALDEQHQALVDRDEQLRALDRALHERDRLLAEMERLLHITRNRAAEFERICWEMADSLPWRLSEQGRRLLERAAPAGTWRRRLWKGSVAALKERLRPLRAATPPPAAATPGDAAATTGDPWSATPTLVAGTEYGQWIRSERADLSEVRVVIGTYGRKNTCDLEFALKAAPEDDEPLRSVTINASELTDNAYQPFSFEPIPDSEWKTYYVSLRSPNASRLNGVAVWCRPVREEDLTAVVDGQRQKCAWRYFCRYGDGLVDEAHGPEAMHALNADEQYQLWCQKHEPSAAELARYGGLQETWRYRPLVSVVMPTYNVAATWLERAIESVLAQVYPNWELCIADDASTDPGVWETIERAVARDRRIHSVRLDANRGIAGASNAALELASGEFVALLDNDDELAPDALYEVVKLLQASPEADIIYSDEDKLTEDGRRTSPFFKPEWSPEMFLSRMYTAHLGVYRKALVDEVGGFRTGYDGSQDYDLVLRLTERTERILHIPKVLYHWRAIAGSTALDVTGKDQALAAGMRALQDHLERTGTAAVVEEGMGHGSYRVRHRIAGRPLVSIIIPTRDKIALLDRCVRSIEDRSTYRNFEIVVVDNQSREQESLDWLAEAERRGRARVLRFDRPFNFSAINHFAVAAARGEHVLLLNNDTEVLAREWLEAMLEHSQRPAIGAVGARLLYPDGTIQHAGVILGPGGVAGHAHRRLPRNEPGYFGILEMVRNYSCVTAACLMMRKAVWDQVGAMNERELAVAFNDVDLCLRIRAAGYRIVYTPYAELFHHESVSRGFDVNPAEIAYMRKTWEWELATDPYYSPNLTVVAEDFSLNL